MKIWTKFETVIQDVHITMEVEMDGSSENMGSVYAKIKEQLSSEKWVEI